MGDAHGAYFFFGDNDADDDEGPSSGPSSSPSDRVLVLRIRAGDRVAFEQLFLRFAASLADFGMAYVHSRDVAEDLVHDLFLSIWRDRATWDPKGTIQSYLFLALRNRAHNYLRHERIAAQWRERAVLELADASSASNAPGTDERLEAAERQAVVVRAIAELPERTRLVATLRWVDGLSYPEIAQRAGITVKGVEKAIARAFAVMQRRLRAYGAPPNDS